MWPPGSATYVSKWKKNENFLRAMWFSIFLWFFISVGFFKRCTNYCQTRKAIPKWLLWTKYTVIHNYLMEIGLHGICLLITSFTFDRTSSPESCWIFSSPSDVELAFFSFTKDEGFDDEVDGRICLGWFLDNWLFTTWDGSPTELPLFGEK